MIITCPSCNARYNLSAAQIGPSGRMLRCARCQHQWFVAPPPPEDQPAPDEDTPPPLAPSTEIGLDELAHLHNRPDWLRTLTSGPMPWLIAIAAALVLITGTSLWLLFRPVEAPQASLTPQLAPLPSGSIAPKNLTLSQLKHTLEQKGTVTILRFTGLVTNTGDEIEQVPDIRVQLIDAKGIELDFWPAEVEKPTLQPSQSADWTVRFLNPPLERIAAWRAVFQPLPAKPAGKQAAAPAVPASLSPTQVVPAATPSPATH